MTPELSPLDTALRGALLAALLILGVALGRGRRVHAGTPVGIALTVGLAVQTLASLPAVERGWPIAWQAPLVAASVGNSVLFWLFARALFDDAFRLKRAHVAVWLGVASVGAGFCLSLALLGPGAPTTVAAKFLLQALPAAFALSVAAAAASEWRADLVEPRRRLRAFIVGAGVAYAFAMVVVRVTATHGVPSPSAALLDTLALLGMVLAAALSTLRVGDASGLLPLPAAPVPVTKEAPGPMSNPGDADNQLAADLDRRMTVDRAYRIDDLTLGVLAIKLGAPEYRLRRVIHERLGHRNFNAYVNALRLAEVRSVLADPAQRGLGVLEIALAAGFASAGPFNRAFKSETGLTPTEFRRRALADC